MNDTIPTYTRDQILLMRKGYARATRFQGMSREFAERQAALAYPMPPITRPRVVTLSDGTQYRRVDGVLQYRDRMGARWQSSTITDEKITEFAGLLVNPTETVPGE